MSEDFRQDPYLLSRAIVRAPNGDYLRIPQSSLQYWRDEEPEPLTSIESQVAPQAPDPEEGVGFSDYARSIMAGGAQIAQGVGWLTRMAGAEDIGGAIEQLGADAVDYWNDGLSDAAKDSLSREFVRKNEGGDWEWGDANLHTVGLFGAQSLLGTAAGAGVGAGVTKVLQTFANPFGRAALQEAITKGATALPGAAAGDAAAQAAVRTAAAAAKKLQLVDKVLGATGFGLGEGAIGSITSGVNVYESVLSMPAEKLLQNDRYQQVFASTDENMPELERHQYAAETVAREASSLAGLQSGLTTALLGAPMGAFFGSILGKKALGTLAQSTPRAMLTGAAGEAAQEFAQGGAEQLIANRQRMIAGEDIELFEGVLNQAIGGAAAGAPLGGALGAMDVDRPGVSTAKQSPKKDAPKPKLEPLRAAATEAFKAGVPQEEILQTVERVKSGEEPVLVAVGNLRKRQMGFAGAQPAAADFSATQERLAEEQAIDFAEEQGVAKAEQRLARTLTDAKTGAETTVTGEKPLRAQYQLVDVNTLVTSHDIDGRANAAFPQELQPRDRSRSANRQWIEENTARFQHEPMVEGVEAGGGPPIVDSDGIVESGNGRVNLLRNVYAKGKGAGYKAYLKAHAARFGLDPADVEKMETPVLVRARQDALSIDERIEFTRAANRPTVASLSPAEKARTDADSLDDDQLARLNVPDDGNVLAAQNAPFVTAFLQSLPATERGGMLTAEGEPTKQVAERIKGALFAKAYKDDRLLALMAEDTDPDVANVVNALVRAAPAFAKVDDAGFDVVGPLVEGVEALRAARKSGQAVDEYLRQQGMFSDVSAEAGKVASFLSKNVRSAKRMSEALVEIAKYAEAASNPTGDLLGDPLPKTFDAALKAADQRMGERYPDKAAAQPDMFGVRQSPAPAPASAPKVDLEGHPFSDRLPAAGKQQLAARYEKAASVKPTFDRAVSDIAVAVGGKTKLADLKGAARAIEKTVADYGGDASRLKDLVRGTIIVDTPEQAQRVYDELQQRFQIVGKPRLTLLDPNAEGYADIKVNAVIDGETVEVQVSTPAMTEAKNKTHGLYKARRAIDAKLVAEQRDATPQEQRVIESTLAGERKAYAEALAAFRARSAATSASNSSAVTSAPLVSTDVVMKRRGGSVSKANALPAKPPTSLTGNPSTEKNLSTQSPPAGKSITGADTFSEHSGWKIGDGVNFVGKELGHISEIIKPVKGRKVRALVHWESGQDQYVDLDKLKRPGGPAIESVQAGEKGQQRLRTDKRIKKYLQAKRPSEPDRIINYRTEAVVGANQATADGADQDVIDFLVSEYQWAVSRLEEVHPEIDWSTLQRKETEPELADLQEVEADEEGVVRDLPLYSKAPGDQTQTPAFKRWFGDSKIVDDNGEPLVVYHGGFGRRFTQFRKDLRASRFDNATSAEGFFFSDAAGAARYANGRVGKVGKRYQKPQMYAVYLSLQNPTVIDGSDLAATTQSTEEMAERIQAAKAAGHDGAIIEGWRDGSGADTQYVVFEPTQIKSATGNTGEFSPTNPGILRSASRAAPGGQLLASAVRQKLAAAIAEVKPLIDVRIRQSPAEFGFADNVQGAFVPGMGVVMFADKLPPGRELEVFAHEVFGHFAMERTPFGKEAVDMVLSMHDKQHASIDPLWYEVGRRWGRLDREEHAKEVIAVMAERGDKHALMTRLMAGVRRFLRKLGIVRDYSDADVRDLIARAARAMRVDVNKALADSPKLKALNPGSSDADILAAIDEAIPDDVVAIDSFLAKGGALFRKTAPRRAAAFRRWFGKSKVVEEDGTPRVVYHGTLGDFSTFEPSRGYVEGDWGAGLYFTSSPVDVATNYAGEGPDFRAKVENEAERIAQESFDRERNAYTLTYEQAEEKAREKLGGLHQGATMPVYLKMENPFVIGGRGETRFTYEFVEDETDGYNASEKGTLVEFIQNLRDAASKYHDGEEVEGLIAKLAASGATYEFVSASTLQDFLRNESGNFAYAADDEGRLVNKEIVRQALEATGFDGIIDRSVGRKFERMDGVDMGTTHYIAFKPTQVKSAIGNSGTFDPSNPDIRFSRAAPADPAIQAIMDRVLTKAPEEFTLKDRARRMWDDIRNTQGLAVKQGLIDAFASVEALERDFTGGQLLDASQSAYKAMLATKNLPSVMAAVMMAGAPEFKNGVYTPVAGRKGIIGIFKPLTEHKDGNLLRQWELFAAANRANRLIKEKNPDGTKRENLFTQAEIDAALTLEQKYPEFRAVLNDWNAFNKQVLDLAQDAGLIDPMARAVWEKNDYVPFYRAIDDFSSTGPRNRRGVAGQKADIKTLKGEDKALGNVFENMMMNTAHLIDASFKNRAMQRVVGLGIGAALQPVPFQAEAIEVTDDQLARALTKAGLIVGNPITGLGGIQVVQAMTPAQKQHWSTIFRRVAPKGPNIVSVMQNGKPEYYEVTDPLVLSSITGMGYDNFADVWGLFRGSKKLLTSAVTADPAFMMANWVRDTLSTWVTSDASMHPFIDAIKGAKAALSNDPALLQMMMAGGGGGGFYDSSPEDIRKLIAQKVPTSTKGVTGTVVDTPAKAWQAWKKIGSATENANRIAVFKAVLAKGGTVAEAAYQARDVLNFSMSGDYAAMRWLTQSVPFLNARVQGLYRLVRGARDNKKAFFLKGTMLLAATMALALRNNDDERYEELKEWEKDLYWHFWAGDQHFAIPKPFEVGAMFATVPERVWRAATGRDSAKILWQRIFQMAADTFAFNPTPQLVKPIIEQYANRSMFTGSPIVGMAERNLEPEAQFTPWTSATMREFADALPDWAPKWLRSPARLEAALRAYTGTMGMYVLGVSDSMVREALGYPDSPGRKIYDMPVVKRFLKDPNPRHTKYADLMYEMLDEANATYSTINRFRREQRFEEAAELQERNKSKLAVRVRLNRISTQVRNVNTQIRLLQLDRTLTAKEKRARIDTLVDRKNHLTRQVAPWADLF